MLANRFVFQHKTGLYLHTLLQHVNVVLDLLVPAVQLRVVATANQGSQGTNAISVNLFILTFLLMAANHVESVNRRLEHASKVHQHSSEQRKWKWS